MLPQLARGSFYIFIFPFITQIISIYTHLSKTLIHNPIIAPPCGSSMLQMGEVQRVILASRPTTEGDPCFQAYNWPVVGSVSSLNFLMPSPKLFPLPYGQIMQFFKTTFYLFFFK